MRLEAAITGNLHKFMQKQSEAAETAVTNGVREITEHVKQDLRQEVTAAGLGQKLAMAWRSQLYPKGGKSVETAGWVWTKAPKLIDAFNRGTMIRSKKGIFLAIPTSAAPKRGIGGKRINPSNFPEPSLGKLRFVYRRGAPSLLVVDNLRARTGKRGGFARASESALRTGRGLSTVVMFILLPQVMLKKRLNTQVIAQRWQLELPDAVLRNWPDVPSQD